MDYNCYITKFNNYETCISLIYSYNLSMTFQIFLIKEPIKILLAQIFIKLPTF